MTHPLPVTSGCYLVWCRADKTREEGLAYWRGTHGQIANKIPAMQEYLQHHFSASDHGFWPAPKGIGRLIPTDWRMDGLTEVRLRNVFTGIVSSIFHMKGIQRDEQNVFDRVLGKLTLPGGGRWWTGPYRPDASCRVVLLLRARHENSGAPFRHFVEDTLSHALLRAGAQELRSYVFPTWSHRLHRTPNLLHDEPINRAYSGLLVIGAQSREALDRVLHSTHVEQTQQDQINCCVAMHAYAVENTYPLVLDGRPMPATWG